MAKPILFQKIELNATNINQLESNKANINHQDSTNVFGVGSTQMYGHLKLSDSTDSTSDNTSGIAATPKAVKSAYDLANAALPKNIESSNNTKIYITGSSSTSTTSSLLVDSGVYISETPGELVATTFTGSLNGNALSATQDSSGNVIVDTYLTKEDFEEYKESGEAVEASEAIWIVTESIPENAIVDIPNGVVYPYNKNAIRVSVNGLILSNNVNYEEVPSSGMSSQIKFLFNVKANSVIQVWVAPQSEIKGSWDFIQSAVELTNENVEQCRQYVQNAGTINLFDTVVELQGSTIDVSLAGFFKKEVTSDITFDFINCRENASCCVTLVLINGGNYLVEWDSSVYWANGTPSTLTENGIDVITFFTINGGTTWYATPTILNAKSI